MRSILVTADHASNAVPPGMALGVSADDMQRHIAWDIGTQQLAQALAELLGCAAITAPWSRLVLDVNREPDHPGLIPTTSDGTIIPGNQHVDATERARRFADFHRPYHDAISAALDGLRDPLLISLHSFTPVMNGFVRPWHCGLLYNQDLRLAPLAIAWLRANTSFTIGDNEPYSGQLLNYTMNRHAEARGIAYLNFEVRQDLISDAAGVAEWAGLLAKAIHAVALHPDREIQSSAGQEFEFPGGQTRA
jgi:predicted N-formylglutamate amidohydrolase